MANQLERLSHALSGSYRVEREIGTGGMATVFLAQDLRHDRKVALKVLRPELAAVIGAERFLAEIKTTANLQHPHILPLHDSGAVDGTVFYVMPFVEGESLRERLLREKQLPIDDALRITREVAAALDYAHRHGVIHRDIKPENILLHDGSALVADFGIALAANSTGGHRMTETGMSLGTPHYMSPEQAMGERELSPRSDVYALGCVCYEMLVGEPPFTGPTPQAIVAKVITEKAPFATTIRDSVPRHVARAIQKALSKLPADRFGSAAQFVDALTNPAALEWQAAESDAEAPPASRLSGVLVSGLAVIAVAAIVAAILLWRRPAPAAQTVRVQIVPPQETGTLFGPDFVLSPDGSAFVYRSGSYGTRLVLRRLDKQEPEELPGTEGVQQAIFSPDGKSLGLALADRLAILPLGGAAPTQLTDSVYDVGAWQDDGTIVYTQAGTRGLSVISSRGGAPRILTRPDTVNGEQMHGAPVDPLPGSKGVLFTIWGRRPRLEEKVAVYSFATGKYRVLATGIRGWYLPTGHLLVMRRDGVLLAAPFDLGRQELTGALTAVLNEAGVNSGDAEVSISENGTLLYSTGARGGLDVVGVSRDGSERRLSDQPRTFDDMGISPDGNHVASCIDGDLWVLDVKARATSRLSFLGGCNFPVWLPGGKRVSFVAYRNGRSELYSVPADGSSEPDSLPSGNGAPLGRTWLPDGKGFLFAEVTQKDQRDIGVVELGPPASRRPLVATSADEKAPTLSPDGRWFAYVSDESGRPEIYARPYPGPGGKYQVSAEGGTEPVWGHTGKEIFYRTAAGLVAAEVKTSPAFTVVARKVLFPVHRYESSSNNREWDVMPDDQTFVFFRQSGSGALNLVINWFEELKARIKAKP